MLQGAKNLALMMVVPIMSSFAMINLIQGGLRLEQVLPIRVVRTLAPSRRCLHM